MARSRPDPTVTTDALARLRELAERLDVPDPGPLVSVWDLIRSYERMLGRRAAKS